MKVFDETAAYERAISNLSGCTDVRASTDKGHDEARDLVYLFSLAEDVFSDCLERLFPILVGSEATSEEICKGLKEIEDKFFLLHQQMQYPRSFRWFPSLEGTDID